MKQVKRRETFKERGRGVLERPRGKSSGASAKKKIRYAVVGLGYISQIAVLPAFANAKKNSELAALVSDDPVKLKSLSRKYGPVPTYGYEDYEECLREVDAVYIALPNSMHAEYTIRAAQAGVHVLCEKPMAVTEEECQLMIDAAKVNGIRLMIAYRLHFEAANLEAVKIVQSGTLGDPRIFNSVFSMQVKEGNIRLKRSLGGGTLYDIGIYCINAARSLFQDDPVEVFAVSAAGRESRFEDVDEMTAAILRFPGDRFASFTSSFGAADVSSYGIVGTKGSLRVDPAYEYAYAGELAHELTVGEKKRTKRYSKRDQFGPELLYFSDCLLKGKEPEPSGIEGLIDVHIVRSLYRSSSEGIPVKLARLRRDAKVQPSQRIDRPPVREPKLVHAERASE